MTTPPDHVPPIQPEPVAAPSRHPNRAVASGLAFLVVGVVGGAATAHAVFPSHSASVTPSIPTTTLPGPGSGNQSGGGSGVDAATIARNVDPGVVDINTTLGYSNARAAGTGMVLTSTGEVLTNNHVISGATSISVTDVGNGKTYDATVVGYDKSHDVAVLQLKNASGLTTVRTSTSPVEVGAAVVGVGNAGGTGGTPSYAAGVITATGQSITASDEGDGTSEQLTGLLETNAEIVAGDSGGPLVDQHGEVVGMDTAASSGFRFSNSSQGFAIPIGDALDIAAQIEAGSSGGTVHVGPTAMLGVGVAPDTNGSGDGARIAQVVSGGPADAAGLAAGDTITSLDGQPITSASDLSDTVLHLRPGVSVGVGYVDTSGAEHNTSVHLAAGPAQ